MVFSLALRGRVNMAKYFGYIVLQYLYYLIIPNINRKYTYKGTPRTRTHRLERNFVGF